MSAFTHEQLDDMVIVGMTDTEGKAWWGGGHFSGRVPIEEAYRLLDWEPVESDLYLFDPANPMGFSPIEGRKAITHPTSGKVLGVFSDGYAVHPYREALLDNLATILDVAAGELEIGTVGCLGNGEQAWVQVRPATGVTVGGDQLLPWLCAYSSLDGSLATSYKPCLTRIVCDNTLGMANAERRNRYKIKHTKNSRLKVAEARAIIGIMWEQADDFAAEVERLQSTTVTGGQFSKVLDLIAPPAQHGVSARAATMADNKRQAIASYYVSDARVRDFHGTAWGVLQASNSHLHHSATVRNTDRTTRQALNTINGKVEEHDGMVLAAINRVLVSV